MSHSSKEILYLASRNNHKLQELTEILGGRFDVRLCTELDPNIGWEETGGTFAENATIKALAVKHLTSCAVLADDSGLEVKALGGAPGVYSSRYAGVDGDDEGNNRKLIKEMVSIENRAARFVCHLAYIDGVGKISHFEGYLEGSILKEARGGGGFGYDPLFWVNPEKKALAELSAEEKNQISHRSNALQKFVLEIGC